MENLPREISAAVHTADRTNYLNPDYEYLKNVTITEWDIKSAGYSVLQFRKLLSPERLKQLREMPKEVRTVKEGLLQKANPKIAEEIVNTLAKIRKAFVIANHIEDSKILAIKKDAMFLINKNPEVTTIKDFFEFRKKGVYTSYICINKKEFYYSGFSDTMDIKGLSDESTEKQKDFILKDIKNFLKLSEKIGAVDLFTLLKSFRRKYLNRELPLEYYRELDSGQFRMGTYLVDNASESIRNKIDISQNYINYIRPLIQLLL